MLQVASYTAMQNSWVSHCLYCLWCQLEYFDTVWQV